MSNNTEVQVPVSLSKRRDIHNQKENAETLARNPLSKFVSQNNRNFRAPVEIGEWAHQLRLDGKSLWMLMGLAKKTDIQKTGRRMQEALSVVGPRLLAMGLAGEAAGRYLYRCIASGVDFAFQAAQKTADAAEVKQEEWVGRAVSLVMEAFEDKPVREVAGRRLELDAGFIFVVNADGRAVLPRDSIARLAVRMGLIPAWEGAPQ